LTNRLRSAALRIILTTVYQAKAASVAFANFIEHLRAGLLAVVLSFVYYTIVTPMAWRTKQSGGNDVLTWKDYRNRIGWRANVQSTSDPEIYRTLQSPRGELLSLLHGRNKSVLVLYDLLMKFRFLAKPPKEKELSADLYVMF